ncbi:hypothetical protein ICW40_11095 [Actinotalea ferrariae]|uniref:hypothetical protein n=1 Tax=Actinotalea ferrariae TaxID=1386098 RepID=UPI001C8B1F67|nr:hypothetical protein [Actinotalea ferrariae]MBX9245350.1 hypothetical protein [Actinotalea ferrariae]
MTRTLAPTRTVGASAVLHGTHPLRGYPVTWHLTPLATRVQATGSGAGDFLVERADGHILDPLVWDLAEKDTTIMSAHEMCELVRRASGGPGRASGGPV